MISAALRAGTPNGLAAGPERKVTIAFGTVSSGACAPAGIKVAATTAAATAFWIPRMDSSLVGRRWCGNTAPTVKQGRAAAPGPLFLFQYRLMIRPILMAALLSAGAALAQGYPSKPIRLIVPLVPGGNQDIMARAVAEEISKTLGQQVVVENRPGQSAIIGTVAVAKSPPDGYTLLSVSTTFARVPAVVKSAGYEADVDFTGVSLICRIPQLLVVNPPLPARSVQDMVVLAKKKPGALSFATSGNGSTGHVAAELFMKMTGTRMLHVPYKGNAQSLVDVMGGQVTMMFDQLSTAAAQVGGGRLRPLHGTNLAGSPRVP